MYEHFSAQLEPLLACNVSDGQSGVVVKEADRAAARALGLNLTDQTIQLLTIHPRSDGGVVWQPLKQQRALAVSRD